MSPKNCITYRLLAVQYGLEQYPDAVGLLLRGCDLIYTWYLDKLLDLLPRSLRIVHVEHCEVGRALFKTLGSTLPHLEVGPAGSRSDAVIHVRHVKVGAVCAHMRDENECRQKVCMHVLDTTELRLCAEGPQHAGSVSVRLTRGRVPLGQVPPPEDLEC